MQTYNQSQFTTVQDEGVPCLVTNRERLGIIDGHFPERFQIQPPIATGGPFYIMDVVAGDGWYTQGRGAEERTAMVIIH